MTWRYTTHCYASLGQLALLARRPRARAAAGRSEPRDRGAHALAEVRELGVADQGRERHGPARLGGGRGRARDARGRSPRTIGQPRQTWMSQLATGRLHAARGRREEALAALPRSVDHHRGSARRHPGSRPSSRARVLAADPRGRGPGQAGIAAPLRQEVDRRGDRTTFIRASVPPLSGRGRKPIALRLAAGGAISSRIASKTTLNCASYLFSRAASLWARSSCEISSWRTLTKVRMIAMLTSIARRLRSTVESIATPCSVKA